MIKKREMKVTKIHWIILFVNIIYVILFGIHFFQRGNFEFVWYVFIMLILLALVSVLHLKYNFTTSTLIGISIWGIGHMFGGSTLLTKERLYTFVIVPLFTTGDSTVFRYDQLMHFYFYVVATAMAYQVLKKYLKKDIKWLPVAVLLVFIGMGIGALNEIFEFLPVLFLKETGVGGYYNVAWDIIFNALGAIVAVIYISFKRKKSNMSKIKNAKK